MSEISSRTPEGPLNSCPICGTHCRIEPSPETMDATCPRCGSLLWFGPAAEPSLRAPREARLDAAPASSAALVFWEPIDYSSLWSAMRLDPCPVIDAEHLKKWEARVALNLPKSLARALAVQNGGRVLGTSIDIYPLEGFVSLSQLDWAKTIYSARGNATNNSLMLRIGRAPGGSLVLDYRRISRRWLYRRSEPRALVIDHVVDGELRAEFSTFGQLVGSYRNAEAHSR